MEKTAQFKVSATTNPNKLAGAIVKTLKEGNKVEVVSIGALAINQAVKALIVSNTFLASEGKRLHITPGFGEVHVEEDKELTSIQFFLTLSNL